MIQLSFCITSTFTFIICYMLLWPRFWWRFWQRFWRRFCPWLFFNVAAGRFWVIRVRKRWRNCVRQSGITRRRRIRGRWGRPTAKCFRSRRCRWARRHHGIRLGTAYEWLIRRTHGFSAGRLRFYCAGFDTVVILHQFKGFELGRKAGGSDLTYRYVVGFVRLDDDLAFTVVLR